MTDGRLGARFFLRHLRVVGEGVHRRVRMAACDHKIYSALTRFVIVATIECLYIATYLCANRRWA
jgi:hypothetical protein